MAWRVALGRGNGIPVLTHHAPAHAPWKHTRNVARQRPPGVRLQGFRIRENFLGGSISLVFSSRGALSQAPCPRRSSQTLARSARQSKRERTLVAGNVERICWAAAWAHGYRMSLLREWVWRGLGPCRRSGARSALPHVLRTVPLSPPRPNVFDVRPAPP